MENEEWTPVDGIGELAERLDLADLDLLAEVTHPIRGRILRRLRHPHTVAELAELLDAPITRLYHHVNRLVDAGLIQVVATRQVAAVTERRYRTVAKSFVVDDELLRSTDRREVSVALAALFDNAKIGFERYVESDGFSLDEQDDDRHPLLSLSELRLSDERRRELTRRIGELLEEFGSGGHDAPGPGTTTMHLFVALHPDVG